MAIVIKNVYIDTDKIQAPTGSTVPTTPTPVTASLPVGDQQFTVLSSDFSTTTPALGFDDLLKVELVSDIDAFLVAITGYGLNVANTIDYDAKVIAIKSESGGSIYENDANRNVIITVRLTVGVSA